MIDKVKNQTQVGTVEIFTTGAHLRSYQFASGRWGWIVDGFEDDSYMDGELCDPNNIADSEEQLLNSMEDFWGEETE